jgi:UDPglucose 6-dehydrogenase
MTLTIAIVGTGYVGLVSGACFSEFGWQVSCIDKDPAKIAALQAGKIPIYEPELENLVTKNLAAGRLRFTTELSHIIPYANAVFIAVGTPSRRGDGHADLSYVEAAAHDIAPLLKKGAVVITKSTVPVGTGAWLQTLFDKLQPEGEISVASNPEFLREGSAIADFMHPDRVVIGSDNEKAKDLLSALYRPLYLIETPILFTSRETAELIKYSANAFLAMKITFINQIADLCEHTKADIHDVAKAIGLDGRIGRKFLHTGPGYGGSCFPKDTRALLKTAQEYGIDLSLVAATDTANEHRKKSMAQRIITACGGTIKGLRLAILGISFKPNTDDMREAASLTILPLLEQAGAELVIYDPSGAKPQELAHIKWGKNPYEALKGADAGIILTEWNEFRALDLGHTKNIMRRPLFIDLRNIYRPQDMRRAGFCYHSLGRAPVLL